MKDILQSKLDLILDQNQVKIRWLIFLFYLGHPMVGLPLPLNQEKLPTVSRNSDGNFAAVVVFVFFSRVRADISVTRLSFYNIYTIPTSFPVGETQLVEERKFLTVQPLEMENFQGPLKLTLDSSSSENCSEPMESLSLSCKVIFGTLANGLGSRERENDKFKILIFLK